MFDDIDQETILDDFFEVDPDEQQPTLFDYEAIQNIDDDDDKELWLIRVPEDIQDDSVESMHIRLSDEPGRPLSRLSVNSDTYMLYRVPEGKTLADDVGVSGHEMFEYSCLVPSRENKGKMMLAPKKIDKCFILTQEVDIPHIQQQQQQNPDFSTTPPQKRTKNDNLPNEKTPRMDSSMTAMVDSLEISNENQDLTNDI